MIYIIFIVVIIIITPVIQIFLIRRRFKTVGKIVITENDGKKLFSLELDKNPDEIENMRYVAFKVTHEADPFAE